MDTTLAVIGDPHGAWDSLARVVAHLRGQRIDGVLIVGDFFSRLVMGRSLNEDDQRQLDRDLDRTLRAVGVLGVPCAWVPGNHDPPTVQGPGNVDGRSGAIAGLRIAGIGGAGPNHFGFPYEWDEVDIRARSLPPCDIILSHTPPVDTPLDETAWGGHHAGSVAIRELARAHDGVLVCGHIHEAADSVQIDRCLCLNAGALGEPFGKAQVGYVRCSGDSSWRVEHQDLETGKLRSWARRT